MTAGHHEAPGHSLPCRPMTVILAHVRHRVGERIDWADARLRFTACGRVFAVGEASAVHEPAHRRCPRCDGSSP